jgi:thymidylate synthase (FAD)
MAMQIELVQYVDHMGSDDQVCDAARVSMNKSADLFTVGQNERLINYLAKHNHWSPFSHCTVKMRFVAPIFVARQLAKHQVGFSWNEVSRRYVKDPPRYWEPDFLRSSAESVKQGSSDTANWNSAFWLAKMQGVHHSLDIMYKQMIDDGVCPEQARAILPQSTMTEWIWTGSLYAWSRMYKLRIDPHTQKETQEYARLVGKICQRYFPLSWSALCS